jgi:predicted dehydrogenase
VFDGNRLADHAAGNRRLTMGELVVEGSAGTLRLDGDGGLWLRAHGSNTEVPQEFDWLDRNFGGDCVFNLQRHVVEHLLRGTPLVNTAREYLANLRIERAIYESNAAGQRIALPAEESAGL